MMNYIDEIFHRADIQQVRAFLLNGVGDDVDQRPYKTRIDIPEKQLMGKLHEEYPNEEKCDEMFMLVNDYVVAVQDVYMEIGMQVGAMLMLQIRDNLKRRTS